MTRKRNDETASQLSPCVIVPSLSWQMPLGGGVPINSNAKWRDRTKADVCVSHCNHDYYLRGRGVLAHPINLGQIVTRESVAQVVPALDLVLHPLRLPRARMQTLALGRRTVSKQSSVRRVPAAAANVVALRENRTRAPKKRFRGGFSL